MADKKIEISLEDKTPQGLKDTAASSQENKELEKLVSLWKKQEEQDKKDLEKLFIESHKKLWEGQDQSETAADITAANERYIETQEQARAGLKDLIASFDDITREQDNELDLTSYNLATLNEDLEAGTQALINLVDGTEEATSWLSRFAHSLSSSASAAAQALVGGGGGGGGGHGGVFGAFGGASAGASVGQSLVSAAMKSGGALAVLAAASLAYVKVVKQLTEMTGGMSGEVEAAKARAEVQQIEDQMRMAQEQGPEIAAMQEISTGIMHEGRAIVRELIDLFGPTIRFFGEIIRRALAGIEAILAVLNAIKDWFAERWVELMGILKEVPLLGRAIEAAEQFFMDRQKAEASTLQDSIDAMFFGGQQIIENTVKDRAGRAANQPPPPPAGPGPGPEFI